MKRTSVGAVLVLALAVAGCGGGGSKTLSKSAYSSKLNSICADYNAQVKKIGQPSTIPDLANKGPKLLDEFKKAIKDARKLNPPAELKPDVDKFLSLADQQTNLIQQLIDAAKANDQTKITELGPKIQPLSTESDSIAKTKLNAPACAQG